MEERSKEQEEADESMLVTRAQVVPGYLPNCKAKEKRCQRQDEHIQYMYCITPVMQPSYDYCGSCLEIVIL
jgi:hypothetical protein